MKLIAKKLIAGILSAGMAAGYLPTGDILTVKASAEGDIAIDAVNFPDSVFREFAGDFDVNFDGKLSPSEIAGAATINASRMNIGSLTGIEYFTDLKTLRCSENQLTSLDLSRNTALEALYCDENQLTSLDLGRNDALKTLYCGDNQLTSLDLSGCSALKFVSCENNKIASLNTSGCSALEELWCQNNRLDSLDISENTALTLLFCGNNELTTLDISKNQVLRQVDCPDNHLTSFDAGNNPAFETFNGSRNSYNIGSDISVYDLSGLEKFGFDLDKVIDWTDVEIDKDKKLITYFYSDTVMYTYDCGNGIKSMFTLTADNIIRNEISIDETNFPDKAFREYVSERLDSGYMDGKLSRPEIENITAINVSSKGISSLKGIEFFDKLCELYCADNMLTSLDLSGNEALTVLECSGNRLSSLDVSGNKALTTLDCSGNQLSSLDVSNNTGLVCLICQNNQFNELDVSNNTKLLTLRCDLNCLTELDVSKNTSLEILSCDANGITALDLSKNTKLSELSCCRNKLTSLELSNNTALVGLYASDNSYSIGKLGDSYNLSKLPGSFDASRASNWNGAEYDKDTNSLINFSGFIVSYDYDCGGGHTASFMLTHEHNFGDDWHYGPSEHWRICECGNISDIESHVTGDWIVDAEPTDNKAGSRHKECSVCGMITEKELLPPENAENVVIDESSFPDSAFRAYVSENIDVDDDGILSYEELSATVILVSERGISSLKGIENFIFLETLFCYGNYLTELDVSNNTMLKQLYCNNNRLVSLDVSKNTMLEVLYCYDNCLTSLDVSKNTMLSSFGANSNTYNIGDVVTSYDLSVLEKYGFDINKVVSWGAEVECDADEKLLYNFCGNEITYVYDCGSDKIVVFTLVANSVSGNLVEINETNFPDKVFREYVSKEFDSDADGSLDPQEIRNANYINLNRAGVSSLKGIEFFTHLTSLQCRENKLTSLDLSKNKLLSELGFPENQIASIDLSKNKLLSWLDCSENKLASLDISSNKELTYLSCGQNKLTSLDVSKNTALTMLLCSTDNKLASLDVSNCAELKELYCDEAGLTSLKLGNIAKLERISCKGNQITSLDLSKNTGLKMLSCSKNLLTSLDISGNKLLTSLECEANQLTSLDVSSNELLEYIICGGNKLTELDISVCKALRNLDCENNELTELDISSNTALEYFYCEGNYLTSLDTGKCKPFKFYTMFQNPYNIVLRSGVFDLSRLSGGFDASKASEWEGAAYNKKTNSLEDFTGDTVYYYYDCGNGYKVYFRLFVEGTVDDMTAIDAKSFPDAAFRAYVSQNFDTDKDGYLSDTEIQKVTLIYVNGDPENVGSIKSLEGIGLFKKLVLLNCCYNQITKLDLSANERLQDLWCSDNLITSLDVSKNAALTGLWCARNSLSSLDVSKNTALETLDCDGNQLTSLDISKNTALTHFYCGGNRLASLDVSKNTNIIIISCYENQLTSLDVSKNAALMKLNIRDNSITSVDVSKNTVLEDLTCDNNGISTIDLSNNAKLLYLCCPGNNIKKLDLSKNAALYWINCSDNPLGSIDVSKNEKLDTIICKNDKLTTLDVSQNAKLNTLFCSGNQLTSLDLSENKSLKELECDGNRYVIGEVTSFDVSQLPGFDASKASNWKGAEYDAKTNSLISFTAEEISYDYNCGNGKTVSFLLTLSSLHEHRFSGKWLSDNTGHWQLCECGEKSTVEKHTPGEWIIDRQPTASETGSRHKECTVCGYVTETEEIEKLTAVIVSPTITKTTAGDGKVTVSWEKVNGAVKYRMYSYRSGKFTVQATVDASVLSAVAAGLVNDTKYAFLVRAFDGTTWSSYTKADFAYAAPRSAAIAKPATVKATAGAAEVTVVCSTVKGAKTYRLFYTTDNGKNYKKVGDTPDRKWVVKGLNANVEYKFLVLAYDGSKWSAYKKGECYAAAAPTIAKPAKVVSSAGKGKASVACSKVEGAKNYKLFYTSDNGKNYTPVGNSKERKWVVTGLKSGVTYKFLVLVYDGKKWSAYTKGECFAAVTVK